MRYLEVKTCAIKAKLKALVIVTIVRTSVLLSDIFMLYNIYVGKS